MTLTVGGTLPEANLIRMGAEGPEQVSLSSLTKGRKVVVFGLPGAYTGPCTTSHVPSFIRTKDALAAKGVEDIICIAVNDPFVLQAWGETTGANEAGLITLGDPACTFTREIGMDFDVPALGLIARSTRYAVLLEDGVIKVLNTETSPSACELSEGEAMLDSL